MDSDNLLRAEAELVLTQARNVKAERIKTLGSPIQLPGKPLAILVREGYLWIAENTTVARKLDLESGKTIQIYRGHTGPVTSLAFCDKVPGSGDGKILITGSWDKTIKLWDTDTKELISSTPAHTDFVKCLLVFPALNLLISGGSDKIVRFWDLSTQSAATPLPSLGSISSHTRPVESLDGTVQSDGSVVLYTADTMGVIKVWDLRKDNDTKPRWTSVLRTTLDIHRTRINEIILGNGHLWTASSDETVKISPQSVPSDTKASPPITHPTAVRALLPLSTTPLAEPYLLTGAGDVIRVYDVSSPAEPELIAEVDAHWHDVTALRLWVRKWVGQDGKGRVEPWIISSSLDGTIRKWRLSELLDPTVVAHKPESEPPTPAKEETQQFTMSEEEERELAELLDSD